MKEYFIVYLNDARVIGPFISAQHAHDWAIRTPNSLFPDAGAYDHADENGDFWVSASELPS